MPITKTFYTTSGTVKRTEVDYEGCVVKVRSYRALRNVSDTLDYSDYQDVMVTEALVWVGREEQWTAGPRPIEPANRFKWVDCSNIFVWRGAPDCAAKVDVIALAIPELIEDLDAWMKIEDDKIKARAEHERLGQEAQQQERIDAERNRPVVGKRMVVFRGRKVKVGTVGTVAFVTSEDNVLLKDDDKWQDRKTPGVWVSSRNLKARE